MASTEWPPVGAGHLAEKHRAIAPSSSFEPFHNPSRYDRHQRGYQRRPPADPDPPSLATIDQQALGWLSEGPRRSCPTGDEALLSASGQGSVDTRFHHPAIVTAIVVSEPPSLTARTIKTRTSYRPAVTANKKHCGARVRTCTVATLGLSSSRLSTGSSSAWSVMTVLWS